MKTLIPFIFLFIFSTPLFSAQQGSTPNPPSKQSPAVQIDPSKIFIDPIEINTTINTVKELFKKEKRNTPVLPTKIMMFSLTFERYSKYVRIERETKIYSSWYKKVSDYLAKMSGVKSQMELASMNNDEKTYSQWDATYKKMVDVLVKALEKPEKISR